MKTMILILDPPAIVSRISLNISNGSNLKRLAQFFGNRSLPFFEIGYLLVIITLVQI